MGLQNFITPTILLFNEKNKKNKKKKKKNLI